MADKIFVSYRRDDTLAAAGRLYDGLRGVFGADAIFLDTNSIPASADFVQYIDSRLAESGLLLAIIGRQWLTAGANRWLLWGYRRRIDNPTDLVRIEIATAFRRNVPVLPVLIDGARMPTERQLPEELKQLARRHAVEVRNTQFASDVERLASAIVDVVPVPRVSRAVGLNTENYAQGIAPSALADRLSKRRYDFFGHAITLLDIFAHARVKLNRYVAISYPAMDILKELDRKNMVASLPSALAQKEKWWTDEPSRVVIVQLGEQIMLDCQELGLVEKSRSDFHEPEYVITTLGLRLGSYLDELSARQAKAFEAGRLLMGTFLELQLDSAYDSKPYIQRASQYLSDLGVTGVELGIIATGINYEAMQSIAEQVHHRLSSHSSDVIPYYEAALHLFMTLPNNDKTRFREILGFIDIPSYLKEEQASVVDWLSALRVHFEGRLLPGT